MKGIQYLKPSYGKATRSGFHECTVCGEVIDIDEGKTMPPCRACRNRNYRISTIAVPILKHRKIS